MSDAQDRPVPKRLADFEIVRRLGVGGMAEVFLARKRGAEGTFKQLVVKRILPKFGASRRFRTMFAEEAQLATRLNHPNIVQVYDFQDYGEDGQLLSMEHVDGPDLRRLIHAARAKDRRLSPYVAAYIIGEVAKGLHYAHARRDDAGTPLGIVHRDVSPQNVLLSYDGAVKIADFGIASANMFRDEEGVLKGKTAYMSPEQARGEKADLRTDVYSLGVVFHELLTARPMRGALDGQELFEAVRAGAVEPPSTFVTLIPPEIEALVMKALKRDADERFQSARDFAFAISRVLFESQKLVDAQVLEASISDLVGRDPPAALGGNTGALDGAEPADVEDDPDAVWEDERTGPGQPLPSERLRERVGREVRHVAVVTLRLHGREELKRELGAHEAERFWIQLRATLEEIAFKRGARWSWEEHEHAVNPSDTMGKARAIVGLTANPARAASDAAWLSVDVHEAISGSSSHLDTLVQASVGIVRAIATGRRDQAGHLVEHELREPGNDLADLLGDRAPAGATWVAGGLYRLLRRDFRWGDTPSIEIEPTEEQPLPRQMRTYSLVRPLTRDERLEAAARVPNEIVGRDAELADLHGAYTSVVGVGKPSRVDARVIFGELGIGKTVLVNLFLNELPPDARVVRAECSPVQSELPYANIAEWARQLTGIQTGDPLEAACERIEALFGSEVGPAQAHTLALRMAELAAGHAVSGLDEGDSALLRSQVTEGLGQLFQQAADDAPLVVVLDGVQWSDRPSLEIICELVKKHEAWPILVLFVTRPDERVATLLEGFVRAELVGLQSEHQLALMEAHLGVQRGVRAACADLLPRASGNPFFLLEMVDALLERGALEIVDSEGGQELRRIERPGESVAPLPSTLEQLIADRLNELPEAEQAVMSWLSVAGGPLALEALQSLQSLDLAEAVERLNARGLTHLRGGEVDVRHPLTRDVAYLALSQNQKRRMHRRLAVALSHTPLGKGLSAAIVASHFARGGAYQRAADYYLEAGAAARSSYQTELALRYYRRVVGMIKENSLRGLEAHEALEAIYRNQGRWRQRREHLDRLRALAKISKNPYWAATAFLRTARYHIDAGRFQRSLLSAERAEKMAVLAGSPILQVQAYVLLAETWRDLGDVQAALLAMDRALSTAADPNVPARIRAEVLRSRGTLLRRVGRVHEAVQGYVEAIAVFKGVGARRMEARAKNSLAYAMFVLGRYEDAIALALNAIQIDLAIGGRFQIAKTLCTIGRSYAALGDSARGLAYLKRARQAHERYADQDARADTLLSTASVMLEIGQGEAAEPLIGDAGALVTVTQNPYDTVHEKIVRALAARATGRFDQAVLFAFEARHSAEAQAYVSFLFYAMAIEAVSRVDLGENHNGILLATMAMGALETLQGSEYGIQTRALCCEALERGGSPQVAELRRRSTLYLRNVLGAVRHADSRGRFLRRPAVYQLLSDLDAPRLRAWAKAEASEPAPSAQGEG
ncbi:MAG: protein kinase [Polyangiaceae bacterium]|nr:protein kinase [Polyangiaceae bacterium]